MRVPAVSSFLAVSVLLPVVAATQTPPMPPDYRGVETHIPGIFVTPVPNAPFTADVTILSHQKLPDGSEVIRTTVNHIARDSQGRIYNETRALVPTTFKGEPRLNIGHIYDPTTLHNTFYYPPQRIARDAILPANRAMPRTAPVPGPRGPQIVESSLGQQTIDDTILTGTLKQRIVPAPASSTGQPITITDEYWYSPDLFVYLIIKHNDPRTGEQIVAVSHISRAEPAAARFQIPEGYKVVDETPPAGAPAVTPPAAAPVIR